jgi:hypothetical protein
MPAFLRVLSTEKDRRGATQIIKKAQEEPRAAAGRSDRVESLEAGPSRAQNKRSRGWPRERMDVAAAEIAL